MELLREVIWLELMARVDPREPMGQNAEARRRKAGMETLLKHLVQEPDLMDARGRWAARLSCRLRGRTGGRPGP